jgi:hypothetical protein
MKITKIASAVVLSMLSGLTMAAVDFNQSTGVGFVGKGDVQLAFGWNNNQLQTNASGVSFAYKAVDTYTATCEWTTGTGTRGERTHNVEHSKKTTVNSNIAYDARMRNQITGFNLTGAGGTTTTGTIPAVGGACPGNQGTSGTWTSVAQTGSVASLFTIYNNVEVKIWGYP